MSGYQVFRDDNTTSEGYPGSVQNNQTVAFSGTAYTAEGTAANTTAHNAGQQPYGHAEGHYAPLPPQQQQYPAAQPFYGSGYNQGYAPPPPQHMYGQPPAYNAAGGGHPPVQGQPPAQYYQGGPVAPGQPILVPLAYDQGQPGHIPRGSWSDGICDFCDSVNICLVAWCLLPVRWAQTRHRNGFGDFNSSLLMYGLPWLLVIIFQVVFNITQIIWFIIPMIFFTIVMIIIGAKHRTRMREKFQIPGSECEDCMLFLFCTCCAVSQEARHVDRDLAIPI